MFYLKIPDFVLANTAGKSPNMSVKNIHSFFPQRRLQNVPTVAKISRFIGWLKWSPTVAWQLSCQKSLHLQPLHLLLRKPADIL